MPIQLEATMINANQFFSFFSLSYLEYIASSILLIAHRIAEDVKTENHFQAGTSTQIYTYLPGTEIAGRCNQ